MPEDIKTENVIVEKAYKNYDYLNSHASRNIRIQCEFQEPGIRLEKQKIEHLIMCFGSARSKSRAEFDAKLATMEKGTPEYERMLKTEFLVKHYESITELSKRITLWNLAREDKKSNLPTYHIASGGGPGMMKAANEGAYRAGGKSVGFGISVPFEEGLNPYVTPELAFEFHYFFTRKFWMAYQCVGLIVAPGGFGTLDELFEVTTLKQTGKIKRDLPIILFGKEYWNAVLNLEAMEKFGMISQADVDGLFMTDDVDEAFNYMISRLESFDEEFAKHKNQAQPEGNLLSSPGDSSYFRTRIGGVRPPNAGADPAYFSDGDIERRRGSEWKFES